MILVFDLGTQSFRATVVDREGNRVHEFSRPIQTHRDGPIAEQDPLVWRSAMREAIAEINTRGIRAVTASATLSGLVCLDAQDEPLRPAILYSDRRPAAQLAAIEASEVYKNSSFRAYSGDFLPQLHYVRDEEPEVFGTAQWLLDATGYLNYLLTGRATLDRYTTFTCYGDPTGRLEKIGVVVEPGDAIGPARSFADADVISVSYDSAAAYLGSSLARPGDALDISGTVTSFGVVSAREVIDPARRVFSIPYGGKWLVRGSTAMSGGVLEWAKDTLFGGTFEEFNEAVGCSPPGANGLTFLPYLAGARAPVWEPAASGVFEGITAQTTKADLARAVYEGMCFSLRHIVETIEALGTEVGTIQLGGGLSRNALMNQMKADITGKAVMVQEDTEVTTIGSASIAGRYLGWIGPDESYCKTGELIHPNLMLNEVYTNAFERYQALAGKLYG